MAISKAEFSAYIKAFQFRELFNEMGWNNDRTKQPIIVDEMPYNRNRHCGKKRFQNFYLRTASRATKSPIRPRARKLKAK